VNGLLFVAISLVAGFGSTAMSLVAGIWILDLTGSVSLAGLAGLCVYAPTLAAPWLGGLVDRFPRRRLVITVDIALALALLTLPAVDSAGRVWLIFAVMLAYGVSYVLLDAGESALLPAALPPSALGDVNGWRSSAQEGMKLIAPLAGAAIYSWRGGGAVAAVSAAMPLLAAAMYGLLRLPATPAGRPRSRHRSGLRDGLAVFRCRPQVRNPVLVAGVAIGLSGFTVASLYSRVTEGLDLPSTFLGPLASAQGAGSIAGGLVAGRMLARRGPATVAAAGAALFAAGCLLWCLPWWPALIAGSVTVGVGLPWTLVAAVTAVQTSTPDRLLGRVSATANTMMFGPIALTGPLGAAAVHAGARVPLIIAAAGALTAALVSRSAETGQDRRADHDEDQRDEPVAVPLDQGDHPPVRSEP
jgi:MFS family permease